MEWNETKLVGGMATVDFEKRPSLALNAFLDGSAVLLRPTFDTIPAWAREGLRPDQLSKLVSDYWVACERYNEARLEELRLASGVTSELTSDASQESQQPLSVVSVGSSASSGKARRRARYRAAKAKRLSNAASDISYGVSEKQKESVSGYCYGKLIRKENRDEITRRIGPTASFLQLLELEMAVVVPERSAFYVSRVSPGLYHMGQVGVLLDSCLASVVAKARNVRGFYEAGTVGAYFSARGDLVRSVDKAPDLAELLGAVKLFEDGSEDLGVMVAKAVDSVVRVHMQGDDARIVVQAACLTGQQVSRLIDYEPCFHSCLQQVQEGFDGDNDVKVSSALLMALRDQWVRSGGVSLDRYQRGSSDRRWSDKVRCRRVHSRLDVVTSEHLYSWMGLVVGSGLAVLVGSERTMARCESLWDGTIACYLLVDLVNVSHRNVLLMLSGEDVDRGYGDTDWLLAVSRHTRSFGYVIETCEPAGLMSVCVRVFG